MKQNLTQMNMLAVRDHSTHARGARQFNHQHYYFGYLPTAETMWLIPSGNPDIIVGLSSLKWLIYPLKLITVLYVEWEMEKGKKVLNGIHI